MPEQAGTPLLSDAYSTSSKSRNGSGSYLLLLLLLLRLLYTSLQFLFCSLWVGSSLQVTGLGRSRARSPRRCAPRCQDNGLHRSYRSGGDACRFWTHQPGVSRLRGPLPTVGVSWKGQSPSIYVYTVCMCIYIYNTNMDNNDSDRRWRRTPSISHARSQKGPQDFSVHICCIYCGVTLRSSTGDSISLPGLVKP